MLEGAHDQVGVVFYNTKNKKNEQDTPSVYVEQPLGTPCAARLAHLENVFLIENDFMERVGCLEPTSDGLVDMLVVVSAMLATKQNLRQYVTVLTRDDCADFPPPSNYAIGRVRTLLSKGGLLQLAPLVAPNEAFNVNQFWAHLLDVPADPSLAAFPLADDDDDERVLSIDALTSTVRKKAHKKRATTHLPFTLGPGAAAATIHVKLYATIRRAWPASKGTALSLARDDHSLLVKHTVRLDSSTGIVLDASQKARPVYCLPDPDISSPADAVPLRIILDDAVYKEVQYPLAKGMQLLGFSPVADLQPWHQIQESTFCYPDERTVPGSVRAFAALHAAMLSQAVMAICSLVERPSSGVRLVALLPQEEVRTQETGAQITSPGFNIIYLPYADDVRYPECDAAFTGSEGGVVDLSAATVAAAAAAAAAEAMLDSLQLGDDFSSTDIPNPHLQRWFEVLEHTAMKLMTLDEAVEVPELPEVPQDLAVPDAAVFEAAEPAIQAFLDAVCGDNERYRSELTGLGVSKGGTKRTAAGSSKNAAAAGDGAHTAATGGGGGGGGGGSVEEIVKLARAGNLSSLTVPSLKVYLEHYGLKKSGRKKELIDRIEAHFKG